MASVVQRVLNRPTESSIDRIEQYQGLSLDALFVPPADRLPDVQRRGRWRLPGLRSEGFTFQSTHVPLCDVHARKAATDYARNEVVRVRRLRPTRGRVKARLLYIHGFMQPETLAEEVLVVGGLATALGLDVWQMQVPYHGRRTPRSSLYDGELFWSADLVRSVEAMRQTALDARTVVSLMAAETDMPAATPIGVSGISLGGFFSWLLPSLDERFDFSMPMAAHMDIAALVRDAPVMARMRRELAEFGWSMEDFAGLVDSWGWGTLRPQLEPARIQAHLASEDHFFEEDVTRRQTEPWLLPEQTWWYATSHMGFIPRMPLAVHRMVPFVREL